MAFFHVKVNRQTPPPQTPEGSTVFDNSYMLIIVNGYCDCSPRDCAFMKLVISNRC
jgi:hypothetical protein